MGILGSSLDWDKSADQLPANGFGAACWAANMNVPGMLRIAASSTVIMNPSRALDTAEPHLADSIERCRKYWRRSMRLERAPQPKARTTKRVGSN
jgi:hypothetical protein